MDTLAFVAVVGGLAMLTAGHSTVHSDDFQEHIAVEPGGTLRVDLDLGEVEIESHDADTVRIETRAGGWPWTVDFELEQDGRDVRLVSTTTTAEGVLAQTARWALWPFQLLRVDVRVWVPRDYSVDAETAAGGIDVSDVTGDAYLRTAGGRIELENVVGDVDVSSAGGRIEIEEVDGTVRAESGGGRIQIEEVAGLVDVKSSGGRLHVSEAGGPVTAITSGGRVFTQFSGAPAGTIETGGGRIEVQFPEDAGVDLHAATGGGRVSVDEDLRFVGQASPQQWDGKINGGGLPLRVRTAGGRIRIEPS